MRSRVPSVAEMSTRTYQVRTFGCQMNVHDSERLALCELTGRVLQKGLELLGIKAPEKM